MNQISIVFPNQLFRDSPILKLNCEILMIEDSLFFENLREYYTITKYYEWMIYLISFKNKMNIGVLFLKSSLTGIITFSELNWITNQQSNFNRLEESVALKLGRMVDSYSRISN